MIINQILFQEVSWAKDYSPLYSARNLFESKQESKMTGGQECVWGLTQSQTSQQPLKGAAAFMSLEVPKLPVWLWCLREAWKRLVKVGVFVGPNLLAVAHGIWLQYAGSSSLSRDLTQRPPPLHPTPTPQPRPWEHSLSHWTTKEVCKVEFNIFNLSVLKARLT